MLGLGPPPGSLLLWMGEKGPEHSLRGGPRGEKSLLRPHSSPALGIWRVSSWPPQRLLPRITKL